MEEQGVPAIAIVTTPFRNTGKAMAESWGKPGYPFLDMPHPIANLTGRSSTSGATGWRSRWRNGSGSRRTST